MDSKTRGRVRRGAAWMAVAAATFGVFLTPRLATATAAPVPPEVPQEIAVPAGNELYGMGSAEGFQIYICQSQGTGFGWALQQPMAVLAGGGHKAFALHYGGPTWMALDGSAVVGTRTGLAPAPDAGAIPWLKLSASPASGSTTGVLSGTTFIQRVNTTGGVAPATGCDAEHVGATAPVPYTADYYFYRAG